MRAFLLASVLFVIGESLFAQAAIYRYERDTQASDFARSFFGSPTRFSASKSLSLGSYSASAATSLDCGNLDITANFHQEFKRLQEQIKQILPSSASDWQSLGGKMAMLSICYAYPTICAQLRHDFLSLQGNLDLRAQGCKAIDTYLNSQGDVGAKQLRAEAQAHCIDSQLKGGADLASASAECQGKSGLALRDFSAGLEKKFSRKKQKVLDSMLRFAKSDDKATYTFLSTMLGEVEVQEDGYWQPLFDKGMLHPHEVAQNFLAEGESKACAKLEKVLSGSLGARPGDLVGSTIVSVIKTRLSKEDVRNLDDLSEADRALSCAGLGRAIGQVAAEKASAKAEAVLASGLLNTSIPDDLRQEYSARSGNAFKALLKAIESDQIPPLDEVRSAIASLAKATREKNRAIASLIGHAKGSNAEADSDEKVGCTDTIDCARKDY
jgi:hypothetical protein